MQEDPRVPHGTLQRVEPSPHRHGRRPIRSHPGHLANPSELVGELGIGHHNLESHICLPLGEDRFGRIHRLHRGFTQAGSSGERLLFGHVLHVMPGVGLVRGPERDQAHIGGQVDIDLDAGSTVAKEACVGHPRPIVGDLPLD